MTGWKTWAGTIGFGICYALAAIFPEYKVMLETVALSVFAPLGAVGVAHKIEKIK